MSDHAIPYFQNEAGHRAINIGVKEFMCVGAYAPFDHPHIFLDMGKTSEIVCPYCSTLYRYEIALGVRETNPADCFFVEKTV